MELVSKVKGVEKLSEMLSEHKFALTTTITLDRVGHGGDNKRRSMY